jgi:hypothetical protein
VDDDKLEQGLRCWAKKISLFFFMSLFLNASFLTRMVCFLVLSAIAVMILKYYWFSFFELDGFQRFVVNGFLVDSESLNPVDKFAV